MAIKATIFKIGLQIADMDRHYYVDHALTVARHPSETDERMMIRLLAFVLFSENGLDFGKGLSSDDEPDLWLKDLTGEIKLWIQVGLPDERTIRKAGGRADQVVVVCYGKTAEIWWNENRNMLQRQDNLTVLKLPGEATRAMAGLVSRSMKLQYTIQEGHIMITSDTGMIEIEPQILKDSLRTNRS